MPVAITGAMRTSSDDGWDGPRNLLDAARVAASPASAGRGAMVVFHGQIFAGETAVKTHATDLAAFSAPHAAPIGRVEGGRVVYDAGARAPGAADRDRRGSARGSRWSPLVVGDDGTLLDLARPEHDGVVIEAFGSGNMPPGAVPAMRRWLDEGKPVVLATRCAQGEVTPIYAFEGGGARTVAMGAIPAGPAHAVAGADGAGPRAVGRRGRTGGDERSRRAPTIPEEVLEIARTLEAAGPRGLVRRAAPSATRCSAIRTPTTTSPRRPRRPR